MHLTLAHISPIVALVAGILILVAPRLLNYVVAIYLIIVGLVGLSPPRALRPSGAARWSSGKMGKLSGAPCPIPVWP
jgi:hypothetical protein